MQDPAKGQKYYVGLGGAVTDQHRQTVTSAQRLDGGAALSMKLHDGNVVQGLVKWVGGSGRGGRNTQENTPTPLTSDVNLCDLVEVSARKIECRFRLNDDKQITRNRKTPRWDSMQRGSVEV